MHTHAPEPDENLQRRGMRTFQSQNEAEAYLRNLPENYSGRTSKTEWGQWFVCYRWVARNA